MLKKLISKLNNHSILEKVSEYFPKDTSNKINKSNPMFKKTDCHDLSQNDLNILKSKTISQNIIIEKEDPKLIKLNSNQKFILEQYINATMYEYRQGKIYVSEEMLQYFKTAKDRIQDDKLINKSCVDSILCDMKNSCKNKKLKSVPYSDEYDILHKFYI
jgi:hypothetical protein